MERITSARVALGGVALVATWLASPSPIAPEPMRTPTDASPNVVARPVGQSAASAAAIEQSAQSIETLHDPSPQSPVYQTPARDPFSFGRVPETAPSITPPPTVAPIAPIALPQLVAILTNKVGDDIVRTVALSAGDDVQVVSVGQSIGAFTVVAIADDEVTIVERSSGGTFHIALH